MPRLNNGQERIDKFGEAFTPDLITNRMLDMLPLESWLPERTFLDPTCGNGNMLVCFLKRKLAVGHDPLIGLQSIYGADIQQDNIDTARARLLEVVYPLIQPELHTLARDIVAHNVFRVDDSLRFDWDNYCPLGITAADIQDISQFYNLGR